MSQLFASGGQNIGASASASAFIPSNEYSGLISYKIDWFDLLAVQGTLKSLLQHHSLRASILHIRSPRYGVLASASASVLPMNIQDWFPLGLTGLIPLLSKEFSRAFSSIPQFKSIHTSALSLLYGPSLTSMHDYWKNHNFDYMELCWQNDVSVFLFVCLFVF